MKAHEGWIGVVIIALVTLLVLLTSQPLRERSTTTRRATDQRPSATSAQGSAGILGYLQTRDHRITVYPGGVYTISTMGGKVLAEKVTLDSLKARDPALCHVLEQAVASQNGVLDARVEQLTSGRLPIPRR